MSGTGDKRVAATILAALRKGPQDVLGLLGALRRAGPDLVEGREGIVHAVVHALERRGAIRVDEKRAPSGLVRYAPPSGGAGREPDPVAPDAEPPPPVSARVARTAARVASGARDPAARGRIVADVLAHLEALGEESSAAFGSPRNARLYVRRADRGRPTVYFASGFADGVRRLLLHEGPWLLAALVIFLLLRAWVVEVFVIPSKSMVPTLLPGDRVVVFKPGGREMPARWDIVTFERAGTTYVKRVAGRGGEAIAIAGGDVLIDGAVATKSPKIRDALRFDYADWEFGPNGNPDWEEVKAADPAAGRLWVYQGPELWSQRYDAEGTTASDVRLRDVYLELVAEREANQRVVLGLAFEPPESSPREVVYSVFADEAWGAGVQVGGADTRHELAGAGSPPTEGRVTLRISHVDGVLRAEAGGGVWEAASEVPPGWVVRPWVRVEGSGGRPLRLHLDKDVHYTQVGQHAIASPSGDEPPSTYAFPIPKGQFFLLGDNTHDSRDSRYSSLGPVSTDELIGPVRVRIWPVGRVGAVR